MKERVISAIIALVICVPLIILGGNWFLIGASIIGLLGLKEIIGLYKDKNPYLIEIISYASLILIICADNLSISFIKSLCIVSLLIFIPIIFYDKETYNFDMAIKLYAPIIFLGYTFNELVQIRNNDIYTFLFILLVPMICDIFAYIVGSSNLGKHKLIPRVSPGKTIEGSIGGTLISTAIATIFYLFEIDPAANIGVLILGIIVLTIIGQLGDLFFSAIKRYYKVKDFSNIMPGHGGILDRVDSIIFVIIGYLIFF